MEKKSVQDSSASEMCMQDVQDDMQELPVRKIEYKKLVMKALLQVVNNICEQKNLQYFAIGKLLTQCIYEQDTYPERQTYIIGMLRRDYDILWSELPAYAEKEGIELYTIYNENGQIRGIQSYIRKKESFTDDEGCLNITIDLRIEPYEYLPADLEEREVFFKEVAAMSKEYRAVSRYMTQQQDTFADKVKRKLKKRQLYAEKYFETQKSSYRTYLNQYAALENPQYAGRVELLIYAPHRLDTIFPIQKKTFLGMELMVPAQYEEFCGLPKIDQEQQIFNERLKVLKNFDQLCKENRIQYFAVGNLARSCAIGQTCMPNKELSVWRLGMLREDYNKILSVLKESKPAQTGDLFIQEALDEYPMIHDTSIGILSENLLKKIPGEESYPIYLIPFDVLPDEYEQADELCKTIRSLLLEMNHLIDVEKGLVYVENPADCNTWDKFAQIQNLCQKYSQEQEQSRQIFAIIDSKIRVCQIDKVFPLRQQSFYDFTLSCCNNAYLWSDDKDTEFYTQEYKTQIAGERLKVLKVIDSVCKENDIQYFAMKNLAIGCTVYQNYVPDTELAAWHIGMLRQDYNQFITLLKEHPNKASGLVLAETLEKYPLIHKMHLGILLDSSAQETVGQNQYPIMLLPFDEMPDDYDQAVAFRREIAKSLRNMKKVINHEKKIKYSKEPLASWSAFDVLQELRQRYNGQNSKVKQIFTTLDTDINLYPVNEIFPLEQRKMGDFSISCPANPYLWHENPSDDYTEYVTAKRTEILKILDTICEQYNLVYFAIANLLISAVVYHDVMPGFQAKQMDIALLRKDYESLLEILRNHGTEYGIQLNEFSDSSHRYPLTTKNVTYIDGEYSNIKIVLLPFDKVPEDYYFWRGFKDDTARIGRIYHELISFRSPSGFKDKRAKTVWGKIKKKLKKVYFKYANPCKLAAKVDQFAQTYNTDETSHTYARVAFDKSKTITEEELFPLRKVPFRDMMLNCPRDYKAWQPVLDAELERQVDCIQKADLILIEEFDKICQKLNIGYFVCGGTMLGYMRHQGFIPWDDDVDVAMLREDYNRFLAEAGPLMPEGFFLQTRESDPNIPYLFSKIRLDRTEYITKYNENRDFHKGICLDIFPFDYLPNDSKERKKFINEVLKLSKAHNLIANHQQPKPENHCKPRNRMEKRYYKKWEKDRQYYWSKSLADSQNAYIQAATRYNSKAKELGLNTVASFVPSYTYIKLEDLLPYQRGKFEGLEVSVPKRPDVFLEMQYGDFMALPPLHMRVAHRLLRWSTWEASGDDQHSNIEKNV